MKLESTLILSLIQGVTEFIPVSSTAHIILANKLFGVPTAGRMTEVSLHLATLFVVMLYFRKEVGEFFTGLPKLFSGVVTKGLNRWFMIAVATVPVIIAGYVVNTYFGKSFRSLQVMGWASIFFGLLLVLVDKTSPTTKKFDSMTYKDALIIGLLQVLALVPGSSRLGTTVIAARLLGYDRVGSAKFSFLLSLPVVAGAMTLMTIESVKKGAFILSGDMALTMGATFLVGYLVLWGIMQYLKRFSFLLIGLYRIALGTFILWYL